MDVKRIALIGGAGSGKTTALENFCQSMMQKGKREQGTAFINGQKICCWSSSYPKTFTQLPVNMDGALVFLDSTKGVTEDDTKLMNYLEKRNIPHVILANKQDLTNRKLEVHSHAPTVPTVAMKTACMVGAVETLLKIISPYQYHQNKCALEVVTIKSSVN
ncbi:GTPase domain-containing protein [Methanobacterium aggregans]|uniref:GTPase domain-containing protein n=1 Tax=Methanobacterium aggregans TaxID=1615586 RepID=UPI001AEA7C98|nr:hypothetical protein [Methanobacterium aggregans]MBP2046542.1 signal recognition particle receptor subunit beta [Methanobacterium aggregans]